MRDLWRGYSAIGIGVWLCSSAFHSRDFWLTEYLDYFAAAALIFYALFVALMVTLQPLRRRRKTWVARIGESFLECTL